MAFRTWLGGGLVLIIGCCSWPQGAHAVILINEILADPPTISGDANHDGISNTTQDEFVELANTGAAPVSLAHWTLSDLLATRHDFSVDATIPGYGFYVVFGGGTPQGFANVAIASTGTLSLNNTRETVTLRDASGTIIDAMSYGAEGGKDASLTRAPDGSSTFVIHTTVTGAPFSPGTTTDGRSTLAATTEHPSIPEPSSLALLLLGLCSLLRCTHRNLRSDACVTT